jgi:hypothetical protein
MTAARARVLGRLVVLVVLVVLVAGAAGLSAGAASASASASGAPGPARSGRTAIPANATEFSISRAICGAAGALNVSIRIECGGLAHSGAGIQAGKQLLSGNVGGAASTVVAGAAGTVASAGAAVGLSVISGAVVGAAADVLRQTASVLGSTAAPRLQSAWFSATYWRMAAIATLLTLPFLFAATVQAALRSDITLLTKAALGYLPLAVLSIAIAAPLTTLVLAASDELCNLISAAAANQGGHVLVSAGVAVAGLAALDQSPFLALLLAMFAIVAAFSLWIKLLLREAAVYVVLLMLPVAFAALAWPARRIWAVRGVEILVALILSKFAIVAVLSLGGAAIAASIGHEDVSGLMAGTVLIMLAALSPWALLRFVPLAEVSAGAGAALRGELRSTRASAQRAVGHAESGADSLARTTAWMSRQAERRMPGGDGPAGPGPGGGGARETSNETSDQTSPAGATPQAPPGAPPSPSPPTPREPPEPSPPTPREPPQSSPPTPREPPEPSPPTPREPPWSERSVLELGPNFGGTPVWPHPDAE